MHSTENIKLRYGIILFADLRLRKHKKQMPISKFLQKHFSNQFTRLIIAMSLVTSVNAMQLWNYNIRC